MSGALDPGLGRNSGFTMMGSPIAQRPPVDRIGLSKRLSSKRRLLPQQIACRSRWVFLRKIKLRSTLTLRRGSDGSRRFKSSPLPLFDAAQMRRVGYPLPEEEISDEIAGKIRAALRIPVANLAAGDSPMVQALGGFPPNVDAG